MGAGAKARKGDYGGAGKQAIKGTRALGQSKLGKRARRGAARGSKVKSSNYSPHKYKTAPFLS